MSIQLFSINQTKDEITQAYAPVNLAQFDGFAVRLVKFQGEFERWHEAGFTELVAYVWGGDPVRGAEAVAEALQPILASRV